MAENLAAARFFCLRRRLFHPHPIFNHTASIAVHGDEVWLDDPGYEGARGVFALRPARAC